MSLPGKSVRWCEVDGDVRNITAEYEGYSMRVKAENHGVTWVVYISKGDYTFSSSHRSRDSAKQSAAKTVRSHLEKEATK